MKTRIDLTWTYRLDFKDLVMESKTKRDEIMKLVNQEAEQEIPDIPVVIPKFEKRKIPFTVATAYSFGREFINILLP